jgi:hypothetical protein
MIKHIVLFKLDKNAPLNEIKTKIEQLKDQIPEIININAGIDINFDPDSSDLSVITDVNGTKELKIYANHPKHLEVISFIKPYVLERRVVDYKV